MARHATAKSVGLSGGALIAAMGGGADAVESQQYLKGEILLEGISQDNYTDGNGDDNDRSNQMWMRTRFGLKVELMQQVETQVTLVYDAEGGDAGPHANNTDSRAELEVNDAYVLLKGFLNDKLFIRAGRQPANYNLRSGHGAFLLDSRSRTSASARRPVVTGWDGLAAWWQSESWKFNLLYYIQDERNESSGLQAPTGIASQGNDIMGVFIDWKPDTDGDERMFITGSWTLERNPYVNDPTTGAVTGEELQTFYLGGTFKLRHGFDLFAEGAFQDGDLGGGIGFDGFGISGGLTWRPPGDHDSALTLQYDHLSGDDDPLDGDFSAFVNTWEGVSDTYIVEHERYGELSELLVGNLRVGLLWQSLHHPPGGSALHL